MVYIFYPYSVVTSSYCAKKKKHTCLAVIPQHECKKRSSDRPFGCGDQLAQKFDAFIPHFSIFLSSLQHKKAVEEKLNHQSQPKFEHL